MSHNDPRPLAPGGLPTANRRNFLQRAAGVAAGAALAPTAQADDPVAATDTLPTVNLGPHQVTRLIIGGNPIYGYSHFNRLYQQLGDQVGENAAIVREICARGR